MKISLGDSILSLLAVVTMGFLGDANTALGFPEFVRHGYFSCTSCHVSPGSGGILTDYGRSYSSEKLSAAALKGEEDPLHGLLGGEAGKGIRKWLLIGGNLRQVQTATESATSSDGRWIHMQRDLEACFTGGSTTACATYGITKHAMSAQDGKTRYGVRRAVGQVQFGESWIVRLGRFSPRYGVMVPDHNAWIQSLSGRGIDDERDQVEATYISEKLEVALSRDQGRPDDKLASTGYIGNVALGLTETIRTGVSYRVQSSNTRDVQSAGIFAAAGIDDKTYVLAEIDRQQLKPKASVSNPGTPPRIASFVKAGHEIKQGFVAYLVQQVDLKNGKWSLARREMYGLGLQVFPRPHFEVDMALSKTFSAKDFTYVNSGYLLLQYYL